MKGPVTLLAAAVLTVAVSQEYEGGHALFVRTSPADGKKDFSPPMIDRETRKR